MKPKINIASDPKYELLPLPLLIVCVIVPSPRELVVR